MPIAFICLMISLISFSKEVKLDDKFDWRSSSHTIEMSKVLEKVEKQIDRAEDNYVDNNLRAKLLYDYAQSQQGFKKLEILKEASLENLNAGNLDLAIGILRKDIFSHSEIKKHQDFEMDAKFLLAAVYFRKGEKSNCMHFKNADSCLFPLKGGGIHREKKWANESIKILEELLQSKNESSEQKLKFQWLLNISYMAIGQFPKSVPSRYLLKKDKQLGVSSLKRFENVSIALGVNAFDHAGGSIMDDFNNDGNLDIIASSFHLGDPLTLYFNNGKGGFDDVSDKAGLKGITGGLHISQIDYDNDGNLDFYVNRGAWRSELSATAGNYPNSLIRNNGDGTFTDVTKLSGLLSFFPTQSSVWADFDNDGLVDLFAGYEVTSGNLGSKNWELFRNQGDGTFVEISNKVGGIELKDVWIKGVATGDFNNDGLTDLFVSLFGAANKLFLAKEPWNFSDVSFKAGIQEPLYSFSVSVFDYNNDGFEDILAYAYDYDNTDISDVVLDYIGLKKESKKSCHPILYQNNGNGKFTNVTEKVGLDYELLAMGSNVGDINNDGWLDLYVGTGTPEMYFLVPNKAFLNQKGERFVDVTEETGLGHLQKGHGVAIGDYDNDGDQDIYAVMGGAYSDDKFDNALFRNPNNNNNWIKLALVGTRSHRSAVGARIKISVKMKNNSLRKIYRTVTSGSSFGGNPFLLHIGLEDAKLIEQIEIRWPGSASPKKIDLKGIHLNNRYQITEDKNKLVRF